MTTSLRQGLAAIAAAVTLAATAVLGAASPAAAQCNFCGVFVDDAVRAEHFSQEDRGLIGFRVWLNWYPSAPVIVRYETRNGTATAPADYLAASGSVSIQAGQTQAWILVGIKHDTLNEPNEWFTLSLTSTSAGVIEDATAYGTILDDDPPRLNALNADPVPEHGGWMWFAVVLSGPMTSTVTVRYATSDGSAKAGSDYVPTSGTLTFSPGQAHKWVRVQLIDDSELCEAKEWLWLTLTDAIGTTIADGWGYGYIVENDWPRDMRLCPGAAG